LENWIEENNAISEFYEIENKTKEDRMKFDEEKEYFSRKQDVESI
jgi:hypothetical protein